MKKVILSSLLCSVLSVGVFASDKDREPKISKEQAKVYMKKSMGHLDKELKMTIKKLSKQTKGVLLEIYTHHDRHSEMATLRQVMQEVGREYETMVSGLMMDNPEMAADAARRLANHRIPKGGLISYLPLDMITDDMLSGLDSMNSSVEGNAIKFAQAVDKGDMNGAADYLTPIANACISCHSIFRGKPGTNSHIK